MWLEQVWGIPQLIPNTPDPAPRKGLMAIITDSVPLSRGVPSSGLVGSTEHACSPRGGTTLYEGIALIAPAQATTSTFQQLVQLGATPSKTPEFVMSLRVVAMCMSRCCLHGEGQEMEHWMFGYIGVGGVHACQVR